MNNQSQITEISNQETKVWNRRENLRFSFFPVSLLAAYLIIKNFTWAANGVKSDEIIGANIFVTLCGFMFIIVVGCTIHILLSNKLSTLWEQKKGLF